MNTCWAVILLLQLAVNSKSQNLLETFDLASVKRGLQEAHDDVGRRVARWLQNQPPISYQEIPGLRSDALWRFQPADRRAIRLLEENQRIGRRKKWRGERERKRWESPRIGQQLVVEVREEKILPQLWNSEVEGRRSQETGPKKRRSEKDITNQTRLSNMTPSGQGREGNLAKERSLMVNLKTPGKIWRKSSTAKKRQHESMQMGEAKLLSERRKEMFREKKGRKLLFRGLDQTIHPRLRLSEAKKNDGRGQLVGESDLRQKIINPKDKKWQKNPQTQALDNARLSEKVIASKNMQRGVSLNRNLQNRKESSDQKKDFGLRMDFVDCKCKFGLNDVLTPWQSVNTIVEFPFLEAEEQKGPKAPVVDVEPVLHPGGSQSINLGLVQGLGALSLHGEPSVDLLDQRNPEKYLNSDIHFLKQVIGGPPLFYSDTKKLREGEEF